jgi:hypothetical protein
MPALRPVQNVPSKLDYDAAKFLDTGRLSGINLAR